VENHDSQNADTSQPNLAETTSTPDIGQHVLEYIERVEALARSLPIAMFFMLSARDGIRATRVDFLTEHGRELENDGKTRIFNLPEDKMPTAATLHREEQHVNVGCELLPNSFVVSLVSHFDFFLSKMLRSIFLQRCEILNASDRALSLQQLLEMGSIDAAREYLLEKEIESVLRESHPSQFEWMEKKFSVQLKKGLDAWPRFVELTERRNLFVHTNGIVSSQYLQACKRHGVTLDGAIGVGVRLDADPTYFENSSRCLLEVGVKLAHVLWRKLFPEQREQADENLMNIMFELLRSGDYDTVKILGEFTRTCIKQYHADEIRRIIRVNEAIAYHHTDNIQTCASLLDAEDWSACSDKFRIAVAVLRDDYDVASSLMRRAGPNGDFQEWHYRDWPLFLRFRSSEQFRSAFQEVFGSPYFHEESLAAAPAPTKAVSLWKSVMLAMRRELREVHPSSPLRASDSDPGASSAPLDGLPEPDPLPPESNETATQEAVAE